MLPDFAESLNLAVVISKSNIKKSKKIIHLKRKSGILSKYSIIELVILLVSGVTTGMVTDSVAI